MDKIYDVFTVGAGPAGLTAALYCRRAEKSVIIAEKEVAGGQVTHSPKIENYPGSAQMSGLDFAERLVAQVKEHGAELVEDEVTALHRDDDGLWTVSLAGDDKVRARSVIIAAGVHHRTLGLAGEDELEGAGVSYCAVCDGAFYRGMTVAVIGGGNSALQEAVMLSEICKKVYVIQNLDTLTGESALCGILATAPNVEIITGTVVSELIEDGGELRAIRLAPGTEKPTYTGCAAVDGDVLPLDGIFVAVGLKPENDCFADIASLDERGYISADESCSLGNGLFVAGDCRTKAVRQITTAVGDGAVAAVAACRYLTTL